MKKTRFCPALFLLLAALLCCRNAQVNNARNTRAVSFLLVSWNVQTFFDGETDGTEYDEYRRAGSPWNRERYRSRLTRLCECLEILDADVLVLEELENEAVVRDINNELPGHLARNKLYPYACFAKTPGTAIGCAVFSRFPILETTVHQVDWRETNAPIAPSMRPIMEVVISVDDDAPRVRLFVNHWKSKSGGETEAAFWQSLQEAALARRISRSSGDAIAACGDFNRGIEEFTPAGGQDVELRGGFSAPVKCRAGWLLPQAVAAGGGSYFYQGAWERIDHIFAAGAMSMTAFSAARDGPWMLETDAGAAPYRYVLSSGAGYSDHLPVQANLTAAAQP
jgi:endonuclease/exonuclease/phosphatase family metal-dependent hydrolase